MDIPSKYIQEAVEQLASLPGVGRKSALRLVLNILKRSPAEIDRFSEAFTTMKANISYCKSCGNISDQEICSICSNPKRNHSLICVVEDIRDIMAIESTGSYQGIYHVLGGVISPMEGIGPEDLNIDLLMEKLEKGGVDEIIFGLSSTMEGDTTNFYLFKKIQPFIKNITTLSRGVSIGTELHYADEITLGRSIIQRTPFRQSFD